MKPQNNGLVELHDSKRKERGFNCMKLITLLTEDGKTDWDQWHGAHLQAAAGQCPYQNRCEIYARTIENHPPKPRQMSLFEE